MCSENGGGELVHGVATTLMLLAHLAPEQTSRVALRAEMGETLTGMAQHEFLRGKVPS
jgi:hypothetical protein